MKNGEEKSYVIADREDGSDPDHVSEPDQVSDISEPEIINPANYSNGGLIIYLFINDSFLLS